MFENIRQDYRVHGRKLRNRAFWALVLYRYGRWSLGLRFKPARWATGKVYGLLQVFAPIFTGVFMDRTMQIGRGFHIIHGGMIILSPQATFGDRVGIMHNVTVGSNMTDGAPRIGSDVFIGTGAVVIGNITVGDGACIAGNSLVISDVPPGALAMGVPAKIYPNRGIKPAAGGTGNPLPEGAPAPQQVPAMPPAS